MKIFGTSGLNKAKAPKSVKAGPKKPKRTAEIAAIIKEIMHPIGGGRNESQANSAKPRKASKGQKGRPLDSAKPNAANTAEPSDTKHHQIPVVEIGGVVIRGFISLFRWSPFLVALFFAIVVVRSITDDFKVLGSIRKSEVKQETATPKDAPVIYEKGLEPFPSADDRIPASALSDVYKLNDPMLVGKLTGIGTVYYAGGRCTASLVGRNDFVVTASHCLTRPSEIMSDEESLSYYSVACNAFYSGTVTYIKTRQPQANTDLDYAFIKLDTPVCDLAKPFQALTLTDEAARSMKERNYPLLSLSVFPFADTRRHSEFKAAESDSRSRYNQLTTFGVFCRFSKSRPIVSAQEVSLTYYTEGCDTMSGNSGGPLLASLDGGKSYQIIATLFGHNKTENIFPRVKGEFAKNLEEFFAQWDEGDLS